MAGLGFPCRTLARASHTIALHCLLCISLLLKLDLVRFKIYKELVSNDQINLHSNVGTVTHQVSSSVTCINPLSSAVFFVVYIVFSLIIISGPQKSPFCFWVKNTQRLPSILLATFFMTKALLLFYYDEVYKKLNKS